VDFQDPLTPKWRFSGAKWGKEWWNVDPQRTRSYFGGGLLALYHFWRKSIKKCDRDWECEHTDRRTQTHAVTKWICNLPMLCVIACYGAGNNDMSKTDEIFCTYYPWPWLDSSPTTMQHVMYFRFCECNVILWMFTPTSRLVTPCGVTSSASVVEVLRIVRLHSTCGGRVHSPPRGVTGAKSAVADCIDACSHCQFSTWDYQRCNKTLFTFLFILSLF